MEHREPNAAGYVFCIRPKDIAIKSLANETAEMDLKPEVTTQEWVCSPARFVLDYHSPQSQARDGKGEGAR